MRQTNPLQDKDFRPVPPPTAPLVQVAALSEEVFGEVGSWLERAGRALRRLRGLLSAIEAGLGPEAGARFGAEVSALETQAQTLSQALARFEADMARLEEAARLVARDISDLDRVVRTIATLSITARVIGHALTPPDRKVAAFVENLSHMSAEAEEILSEVTGAMDVIRQDMRDVPACLDLVRAGLAGQVLHQFAVLAQVAQDVQRRRPRLMAAGRALDEEMARAGQEVGQLIMALQVGDAFRQRLGRVTEVLDSAQQLDTGPGLRVSLCLSLRLLNEARSEVEAKLRLSSRALQDLDAAASHAVRLARGTYLEAGAGMGPADTGQIVRLLETGLADVEVHLSELDAKTARAVGEVQQILAQERTLRQIAHKVRLAGLNAIVICTQLGGRGNALREVAQWLRSMTDEADETTASLQQTLGAMRALAEELGGAGLAELAGGARAVVEGARRLQAEISAADQLVGRASSQIGALGTELPALLRPAASGLAGFPDRLAALSPLEAQLRVGCALLAEADLPFAEGSDEARHFDRLRQGYTMAAEREIHDAVLHPAGRQAARAVPEQPAAAPAAADDDLDDILF